ncbi:anaphase-promoting complex subunit 7 isoform X3 [Chiloscyllium plagiosum]|uniref:anaphase-promoting complex subunit 7 isoform X3 n=1 Tax=Chiloscyllium plagiosum TaxID=36176 RepID=UPI001CB7CAE2|nr:anaphase-promoting complex subunit 7 isoform X3 [Chiloscyllium plagiosum]
MNVIDHVRDMVAAGLYSNVRLLSSLLLTMSDNNPELFSPVQKYQLLVYNADALFHDKEYRNAESKYKIALQQKKALSKTTKVRPAGGSTPSTPQTQGCQQRARKVSECLPSEIEVKYKMAECYTMLRQERDAVAILDTISTRQRTPKINMMLANLYKKAGQERSAVTSYKEVLRQCPLALDAILGLLSLSVKGAEVASLTMNVIQSIPNLDWLSVWIKAYAFVHTGDNTRAINTICSLEKKSLLRDNVDLMGSLADLYFRVGDNKNAILKFEQAQMLDPYIIKGMDVYGYLLAGEGRLEDVENLGGRLFNISDQHAEPWVVSGYQCLYSKRYSRALYLGAKAIQLNSNSVQALLLKGAALRALGRIQEAIIHFREAMRLAPCRMDCYDGLVECYLASNSIREAMVMANNVFKTLGPNAQTLTLFATVCLEDPMTQEKARTLLDKALAQKSDYLKAVVKKAELLIYPSIDLSFYRLS